MRILFDQATPVQIRRSLKDHTVITAEQQGWSRMSNGQLLRAAEDAGFDLLVTPDQNLPHQQNLAGWKIAVVVLGKANWPLVRPAVARVVAAIEAAKPGTISLVPIPDR